MKITTSILPDGRIACETVTPRGHYRSVYRGYTLKDAKKKFTNRVIKAEQEELDRVRLEAILMCLNCEKSAQDCKGKCRYKPKNGKKLPRGKGEVI